MLLNCKKMWVEKVVVFLFFVMLVPFTCASRATISASGGSSQKLQVQKHLKKINKPHVKSIKSPDGDIIDCVNVSDQIAFDHPQLNSHKIQMRPNYHPEGKIFGERKVSSNSKHITQLWHQNGRCPKGTIPVRRTRKDEILRANSIQQFGKKKQKSFPQPKSQKPLPDGTSPNDHEVLPILT
ncbi:putative neprosin activation peptide [Lupinus albus]|uniref:Putative neprosin activation peptide n=1 Tax=Lupinus albus TaxID=3870 RepID=A0A6A4R3N3_LUPAL|nr:putative neprosin activation peptide [Lupinus albus]